jgi:hypothetical protein
MRSHELTIGRTFGVAFDHGEDFVTALAEFCREQGVRQGFIPMFIAGFAEAELVGTCGKLDNPQAPGWDQRPSGERRGTGRRHHRLGQRW